MEVCVVCGPFPWNTLDSKGYSILSFPFSSPLGPLLSLSLSARHSMDSTLPSLSLAWEATSHASLPLSPIFLEISNIFIILLIFILFSFLFIFRVGPQIYSFVFISFGFSNLISFFLVTFKVSYNNCFLVSVILTLIAAILMYFVKDKYYFRVESDHHHVDQIIQVELNKNEKL